MQPDEKAARLAEEGQELYRHARTVLAKIMEQAPLTQGGKVALKVAIDVIDGMKASAAERLALRARIEELKGAGREALGLADEFDVMDSGMAERSRLSEIFDKPEAWEQDDSGHGGFDPQGQPH